MKVLSHMQLYAMFLLDLCKQWTHLIKNVSSEQLIQLADVRRRGPVLPIYVQVFQFTDGLLKAALRNFYLHGPYVT